MRSDPAGPARSVDKVAPKLAMRFVPAARSSTSVPPLCVYASDGVGASLLFPIAANVAEDRALYQMLIDLSRIIGNAVYREEAEKDPDLVVHEHAGPHRVLSMGGTPWLGFRARVPDIL